MSWNYRVVKETVMASGMSETYLQIKEVYYNKKGEVASFGDAPVPYGESKEDIRDCLNLMIEALDKDVIDKEQYDKDFLKNK